MAIVEINGIKMDIDLSTARHIDEYKVGDNVKVLQKRYDHYDVLAGVITEFVSFKSLPTIVIAVYRQGYIGADIEFLYYNAETTDVEITPCLEHELKLNKDSVVDKFKQQIESKRREADELEAKLNWFEKYFNKYFENTK